MSDPHVDRWRQKGRVSAWKHKQRHVDWNITADADGCEALLDLLGRMKNGSWPSQKVITLCESRRTASGVPEFPATFASELVLKYPKSAGADDYWSLEETESGLKIILGLYRLEQLCAAVADIRDGGGDYSIGNDDGPLWVWWFCN
jgi:hypothetical protein